MSLSESWKRFWKGKLTAETQKKLPAPDTIKCGLCESQIDAADIFTHWRTHIRKICVSQTQVSEHEGVMRTAPAVRSTIFIVRRPAYHAEYKRRFNLEFLTMDYFAQVIVALKQENPEMRFQYVNAVMGDSGEYLKTLLIIGEWYE